MNGGNLRKIYFLVASLFLFGGTVVSFVVFLDDVLDFDKWVLSFGSSDYVVENFFSFTLPFFLLFVVNFVIFWRMTKEK